MRQLYGETTVNKSEFSFIRERENCAEIEKLIIKLYLLFNKTRYMAEIKTNVK
jgi:hypothetical protein